MQYETGRTGYDTNAPKDTDNDFLCAVQLQRIASALEEVLRLVKKDQEESKKRWEKESEQTPRASNGPRLPAALAMAPGSGTKLQAPSGKLQAPGCKLDKIKL